MGTSLDFLQSQAGKKTLCGLAQGAPVLYLPAGLLYPALSRLSPPLPRKMLQGACRRAPGPGGGACEVCALSPYCVCQEIPPQAKMGLPCASWVWGKRAETPAPGTEHYTALCHRRPRASEPRTCRPSSGRQGALGVRGWRCEARSEGDGYWQGRTETQGGLT